MAGTSTGCRLQYFNADWDSWVDVTDSFQLDQKIRMKVITGSFPLQHQHKRSASLANLLDNIRGKKTRKQMKEKESKRSYKFCNIQMGIMSRKTIFDEYKGVRKGGGTRIVNLKSDASYKDIIDSGIRAFFHGKKAEFGRLASYTTDGLGTYQGLIPEEGFNLSILIEANNGPSKTKLYVYLTARKHQESSGNDEAETEEADSEASSSSLPDFGLRAINQPQPQAPPQAINQSQPQFADAGTPTVQLKLPVATDQCILCMDREADFYIVPCSHKICFICGTYIYENREPCPFCRGNVVHIFKPAK